jgi:hypothetical protein
MRMTIVRACLLVAAVMALSMGAAAQEGYPLQGTWYGDYTTGNQKHDLTVVMKWDGQTVTGTINPGANATPIKSVVMQITPGKPAAQGKNSTTGIPPIFHVHLEFDAPSSEGGGPIVFEGTIKNPVGGNRTIVGTFTRGAETGPFQVRRL